MAITITCPVCNKETNEDFCEHCGFEIHVLPQSVSEKTKKYEDDRIDRYKRKLKETLLPEEKAKLKEVQEQLKAELEAHETTKRELEELRAEKTFESIPFPAELVIADKCPVCEAQMTEEQSFCEHCGWSRTIYPQVVPPAIVEMEKQRVEMMRQAYQQRQNDRQQHADDTKKLNEEIERQKKLVEEEQKKNEHLVEESEKKEKQLKEANDKLFDDLYAAKGELEVTQKERDTAQKERDAAVKDRDQAQQNLKKEKDEHAKTKRKLEALYNNGSVTPPTPKPASTPVNRGEKKGEVVLSGNGKTVTLPLYEGENVITAPQGFGCTASGDLFRVEINGVDVRIFDSCGQTRRANGREFGSNGKDVVPGEVFWIDGTIKATFNLPKIDFRFILKNH